MTETLRRSLPLFEPRRAPRALAGARHYRPRAGHPDLPRLLEDARDLAATLRPTLARPTPVHVDARRRARSLATAATGFVENRRRAREGREDLLPLYFIWTTHRTCNFSCTYCDDHRGSKYPDLPDDDTLDTEQGRRLLRVMRSRASSVYFAGGEPTLRKDLPELVREARDLAYWPIVVNTNGSAFDRLLGLHAWRGFLADVDTVVVSLDGLDLDFLGQTWGTKRPEDVFRNLLLLRELADEMRVKLMVNAVVQPGRVEHASDVLDLANDLGIWFTPVPQNVGPRIRDGLLDDPAYVAFARRVLARKAAGHRVTGSLRMNRRLLFSEPLVCRNTLKPHVDADGSLFWPCKASVAIAPEKLRVLDFEHVDDLWAHGRARVDPARFQERCGARCNWAQNYSTDAYAHGLARPWSVVAEATEFLSRS